MSFFLIVLRIYIWKGFPLASIHSFKYTMVWSNFEIPRSFIVENSKKRINFNRECVKNVTFLQVRNNCVIFKQVSEYNPNSVVLVNHKILQLEFIKNG